MKDRVNLPGLWKVELISDRRSDFYNDKRAFLLSVTIAHYFLHSVHLCFSFVSCPVDCSSSADCIPFFLSHFTSVIPEYSIVLLNVLSHSSTFSFLSHTSHNRNI